MRESLTIVAGLLVALLTAALIGPYFVDWTAQRALVEGQLSDALGFPVTVAGGIDLRLLPSPVIHLERVVAHGTGRSLGFSARSLDAELAPGSLLQGRFTFLDATIEGARLDVVVGEDGGVDLAGPPASPDAVRIEKLTLRDATLAVRLPSGREVVVPHIDADADARSLAGPFRIAGVSRTGAGALGFRLTTGARENGRMRVKLGVDEIAPWPRLDLDGMVLSLDGSAGTTRFGYEGAITAQGRAVLGPTPVPWKAVASILAMPEAVRLASLDLRAGADERAMVATGTGELTLSTAPSARLSLTSKQIDVDRLLASPAAPPGDAPPSAGFDLGAFARALADDPAAGADAPFPVAIDMAATAVVVGGETLTDVAAGLTAAPGQPVGARLRAAGPGGSRIDLVGTVEPGTAAVFRGHVEASAREAARAAEWLAPIAPASGPWGALSPFRTLAFSADVDLSSAGFAARGIRLGLDRSTLTGTVAYTRMIGDERARVFVDLTSDALDLEGLPDMASLGATSSEADLDIALDARAVKVARVGRAMVDSGRIALKLTRHGRALRLERLSIARLGGANLAASGFLNGGDGQLDAQVDAVRLQDLADLVRRVSPGPLTDALAARAAVLSPAKVAVHLGSSVDAAGAFGPVAITIDGSANGTAIRGSAQPDPGAAGGTATLTLDAAETSVLLRQLGVDAPPVNGFGRGHVTLDARSSKVGSVATQIRATLAGTDVTFKGNATDWFVGAGKLTLKSTNVAPLVQTAGLLATGPTVSVPIDVQGDIVYGPGGASLRPFDGRAADTAVSGDLTYAVRRPAVEGTPATAARLEGGLAVDTLPATALVGLALGPPGAVRPGSIWPADPFAPALADPPATSVRLSVGTMPLGVLPSASKVRAVLRLAPGLVAFDGVGLEFAGGKASGDLTLRRDRATASLAGHLALEGVTLDAGGLSGGLSGGLDVVGTGTSAAALMAGLAGEGEVTLSGGRVQKLDVGALGRVVAGTQAGTISIEDSAIARALAAELDRGPASVSAARLPLALAGGVLRVAPAMLAEGSVLAQATATLDMRTLALDLAARIALREAPKDWLGEPPRVDVRVPLRPAGPVRLESAALANGIAQRALMGESARLDALDFDIRERAFFAQRLKASDTERARSRDDARRAMDEAVQRMQTVPLPPLRAGRPGPTPP